MDTENAIATAKFAPFVTTGKDRAFLATAEDAMLNLLKKSATIQLEDGLLFDTYDATQMNIENPYPVVVLVNGAGGNGKDTFVENVGKYCSALNLSSITEVKEIASILVDASDKYDDLSPVCAGKHKETKSDRYRQFLHDIKMAWSKFCDGPNIQLLGQLRDVCTDQFYGKEKYDIVFMHVREKDELSSLKTYIEDNFGLIVITVLVDGLVDVSEYQNDCDHNVNEYNHDITIHNQYGRLDIFEMQARLFASRITAGNKMFGINVTNTDTGIVDTQPAGAVITIENGIDTLNNGGATGTVASSFHTDPGSLG